MRTHSLWIWLMIGAGLVFWSLSYGSGPTSPLWWSELALYALMILGLLRGGFAVTLPPPQAALAFVALSWAFGMAYELSLTVDGTGLGGVHPNTAASFLLAQPDYLMIAAATLWLIHRWHLGFAGAVLIACGKSLTEGLVFTGVLSATLLSPNWPYAPLVLAYYTLAYASFVALPLLILAPKSLWSSRPPPRPASPLRLILTGFALAFVIRILWGLAFSPAITWAFNLPPNSLP
jgi:hypothetical protein